MQIKIDIDLFDANILLVNSKTHVVKYVNAYAVKNESNFSDVKGKKVDAIFNSEIQNQEYLKSFKTIFKETSYEVFKNKLSSSGDYALLFLNTSQDV